MLSLRYFFSHAASGASTPGRLDLAAASPSFETTNEAGQVFFTAGVDVPSEGFRVKSTLSTFNQRMSDRCLCTRLAGPCARIRREK